VRSRSLLVSLSQTCCTVSRLNVGAHSLFSTSRRRVLSTMIPPTRDACFDCLQEERGRRFTATAPTGVSWPRPRPLRLFDIAPLRSRKCPTRPIKICPRHRRTPSEEIVEEEKKRAEARDQAMFSRVVNGMIRKQNFHVSNASFSFRCGHLQCLEKIIKTYHMTDQQLERMATAYQASTGGYNDGALQAQDTVLDYCHLCSENGSREVVHHHDECMCHDMLFDLDLD